MHELDEVIDLAPVLFMKKQSDDMDLFPLPFGRKLAARYRDQIAVFSRFHEFPETVRSVVIGQSQCRKALSFTKSYELCRCQGAIREIGVAVKVDPFFHTNLLYSSSCKIKKAGDLLLPCSHIL